MASPGRICVFLTGALGDFINALPALYLLRERFSSHRITLVGNPLWLPLVSDTGTADEIRSMLELPLHAGFQKHLSSGHVLSRFLNSFDLIISWFGDQEGMWNRTLHNVSAGRILVRPFHKVHAFEGHASEFYVATLKDIGIMNPEGKGSTPPSRPHLRNRTLTRMAARGSAWLDEAPYLCLHPGSGSRAKNWPKENFLEVACQAYDRWQWPSVVLLGPAEREQRSFWEGARESFLRIQKDRSILEVSEILCGAFHYVGNDSGITHLAALLGVPSTAVFGPTDAARWGPRGDRVTILRYGPAFSPCSGSGPCHERSEDSLARVGPEEVLEVLTSQQAES